MRDQRLVMSLQKKEGDKGKKAYTTICLRARRALRMNLRVRSVTGCSRSAILVVLG